MLLFGVVVRGMRRVLMGAIVRQARELGVERVVDVEQRRNEVAGDAWGRRGGGVRRASDGRTCLGKVVNGCRLVKAGTQIIILKIPFLFLSHYVV